MKKILLLILIAVASVNVQAQDVYVAGNVSLWRNDDANKTAFTVSPEIGCNLDSSWALGVALGYNYNYLKGLKTNAFSIAPYARYSYYNNDKVRLFIDGGFGFSTLKTKGSDSTNGWEIGLKPGIAIKLNKNFSLLAKCGFVGYRDDYFTGEDGFGFSLNSEDISLGVHYEF